MRSYWTYSSIGIFIIAVALGGYLLYYHIQKKGTSILSTNGNTITQHIVVPKTRRSNIPNGMTPAQYALKQAAAKVPSSSYHASTDDWDGDGLTNEQEKKYGTNPNEADTDHDGLTDYQEIMIFHTNPLKADTDGDGYPDGYEVMHGFNPRGPGKLIIPSSTISTTTYKH